MATSVQTGKAKQLTLLGFFAITASMVMAVYEYPTFATSGFSLVFFLLLGGILWFIPVGLCAAEMATVDGWEEGGVFAWVSNTLGPRWGFAAISFGYLQIAIGFIPMLYFVLGALSYILKWPALNEDPITKTIAALIILWALALTQFGGTKYTARIAKVGFFAGILLPAFILIALAAIYLHSGAPVAIEMDTQFGGTKYTARIAKVGFFAGILLPAFILIALAAIYLHSGAPVAIEMDSKTFFPDFSKVGTLVVFVAFILSYMGVEASATHVNEMSNPGRDYPLAMLLLMVAAICLSSVGGLSIAMVIPGNEINLSAGVMQTFTVLMSHVAPEIEWTVRVISALLLLGVLAEIASWIVGPSRGMYVTAQKNLLPAAFAKLKRTFNIPGGKGVKLVVAIVGLLTSIMAFIVSFLPPDNIQGDSTDMYFELLVVSFLVVLALPFILYAVHDRKGKANTGVTLEPINSQNAPKGHFFLPPDNIQGDSTDMYVELLVVSFLVVLALPFILYAVHDRKSKANTGVTLEPINSQNAPKGHFFLHPRARSPHYIVMNDKKH